MSRWKVLFKKTPRFCEGLWRGHLWRQTLSPVWRSCALPCPRCPHTSSLVPVNGLPTEGTEVLESKSHHVQTSAETAGRRGRWFVTGLSKGKVRRTRTCYIWRLVSVQWKKHLLSLRCLRQDMPHSLQAGWTACPDTADELSVSSGAGPAPDR